MGVLVGDTTGDGVVNSSDVNQVQSQLHQPVTSSNFRDDANADGIINPADVNLVKSKLGTGLNSMHEPFEASARIFISE